MEFGNLFSLGIWRGLVKEAISILAWVSSFFISITFVSELSGMLFESLGSLYFPTLEFCSAVYRNYGVFSLVSFLMNEVIRASGLKSFDKLLGAVFGLAKGTTIIAVLCAVSRFFAPQTYALWYESSVLVPQFVRFFDFVWTIFWDTPPSVY